jgi:glyoxylase-like metal-dependent hydrolase (beta-lactamase superfamily II)
MPWSDPEVQTVLPGVHRAPVPLPHDGLRAVNVYVLEDGDGVTLVDAGWDSPLARQAVAAGLAAAGAGVGDIRRILVTHVHYDHVGQASALVRDGAGGYWLGEDEEPTFRGMIDPDPAARAHRMRDLARNGGADLVAELRERRGTLDDHVFDLDEPDRWIGDGDVAALGDGGAVEAVATPGHTAGHLCFLDRGRRVLLSGDHVLPHITPSIGLEGVTKRTALADFLSSLARVRALDVDLVLPAHGPVFSDLAGRVDELTAHHDVRLGACLAAISPGGCDAFAVATRLPWTRRETPFDELDLFNRLLATWETLAHLELLAARGDLRRDGDGDRVAFHRGY